MRTLVILLLLLGSAMAGDYQNPSLTPGAVNPALTKQVLCSPGFSTKPYRNVSQETKREVFARYHVIPSPRQYEIDHLIPLELGGANSISNLWPQSFLTKPWNAHVKDTLENRLHELVCAGTVTLPSAREQIKTDWIKAWKTFVE
jgi:hypothetical protein